jgi:hypothetical protein
MGVRVKPPCAIQSGPILPIPLPEGGSRIAQYFSIGTAKYRIASPARDG